MKNNTKMLLCGGMLAMALAGCDDNEGSTSDAGTDSGMNNNPDGMVVDPCDTAPATVSISTNVTEDTTWCTGQTITLLSRTYVENGATLTIQPGVTVLGGVGAASALVVTRNGHLVAEGTAAQPIVMSSGKPAGNRQPGDWGGIVLFGRAPVNEGANVVFEGLAAEERNTYGGTDDAWNCGSIEYVRVEFAGQVFATDKEFNGVTVAGCGNTTSISHVQVHRGADDGIEFFGGSANFDHILVTQQDDDGLDWDFGWHGRGQYLIVHNTLGDAVIEADNNALGTVTGTPRSEPTLYNLTFVGAGAAVSGKGQNIMLRRGTLGLIRNTIFQDLTGGLQIRPTTAEREPIATFTALWPTRFAIENSSFLNVTVPATTSTSGSDATGGTAQAFDTNALVTAAARNNTVSTTNLIAVGADVNAPNFCPAQGTAAVTGATAPAAFDQAGLAFAGACAPGTTAANAWYAGWSSFPAN